MDYIDASNSSHFVITPDIFLAVFSTDVPKPPPAPSSAKIAATATPAVTEWDVLKLEAGTWDADIEFLADKPDQPLIRMKGVQTQYLCCRQPLDQKRGRCHVRGSWHPGLGPEEKEIRRHLGGYHSGLCPSPRRQL